MHVAPEKKQNMVDGETDTETDRLTDKEIPMLRYASLVPQKKNYFYHKCQVIDQHAFSKGFINQSLYLSWFEI